LTEPFLLRQARGDLDVDAGQMYLITEYIDLSGTKIE
jgi:hypothetical protein